MNYTVNGTKLILFNNCNMLNDYYQYIISIIKYIIEKYKITSNIVLNNNSYCFDNEEETIRININIEHTLIKENGRGLLSNTPIGKIKYDNNKYYFVRVVDIDKLSKGEIVIDYSNPNIYNINSIEIYKELSNKLTYIAPIIYKGNYINVKNRNNDMMTTFYNENEPRRKRMIEIIKSRKLNYKNINNCFDKDELQKIYQNTKILINIHQTNEHDTFEELRCLPALQNGIIVLSEESPLNNTIPYNDLIIWSSYENIVDKAIDILENYEKYYSLVFNKDNILLLNNMDKENKKVMEQKMMNNLKIENNDLSVMINNDIKLERYYLHSEIKGEKKMDLYIYEMKGFIKIAYLSLAKCASNEVRNILKNVFGNQTRLEINIKNKDDIRIKDLVIFTLVRNPFERFHSAFNMMFNKTSLEMPNEFLKFTENPDACKINDPGHWTPQYDKIITETGEILPKYIGNINNLYDYIEYLINKECNDDTIKNELINKLKQMKYNNEKQHVRNKDFNDNYYYLSYYNIKTYQNVSKYLKKDIDLFNFGCDLKNASLTNLSLFYGLDKNCRISHNYMPGYENIFKCDKHEIKEMLEIGLGGIYNLNKCVKDGDEKRNYYRTGNSLRMWRDYFVNANIYGIDINKELIFSENRIKTFVANQNSEKDLENVMHNIGKELDVILDDGSHDGEHQVFSFIHLNKYLSSNGKYIIEDIQSKNINGFLDLSIFPVEIKDFINKNFNIEYFDTRNTFNLKEDDFITVFTKK